MSLSFFAEKVILELNGPAAYSCNTVTANQIEAFQTADQRAEMMSQPIRFFSCISLDPGFESSSRRTETFYKTKL